LYIGFLKKLQGGHVPIGNLDVASLLGKTANHHVLFLAMLLHDTGKGIGDQEIEGGRVTRKVAKRLGLSEPETELAGWLVENHLLFSDTAQGRDLGDSETISRFATKVGSLERLRLLLALTVADIRAVGPDVWTGWKSELLASLYAQTENLLLGRVSYPANEHERRADDPVSRTRSHIQNQLQPASFAKTWVNDFEDKYWLEFSETELLNHGKMVERTVRENQSFAADLAQDPNRQFTTFAVWGEDRPGLFAGMCAIASVCGATITSAKVLTTHSGKALEVLRLTDGRGGAFGANNARALHRMNEMVRAYFEQKIVPKPEAQKRSRRELAFSVMREVVFDNETSQKSTLIECTGADSQGLLYQLAQSLNQCRVNIHSAHIMTYGERAVDIFYVNEVDGQKITNARRIANIRHKLMAALGQIQTKPEIPQARASRHR
jgi:[protein-PII] uridylyltransferase